MNILNDTDKMLSEINVTTLDELFSQIPKNARIEGLNLPDKKSEIEVQKTLLNISKRNNDDYSCFLGGGSYNKYVPPAVSAVSERFEFLSAYTPYQAEISQGTLETMYDFQSMICELTGQDVSNSSVYDGASACAEAILMAVRITKKKKAFVSSRVNPNYLKVIKTYLWAGNVELEIGEKPNYSDDLACILYQTPNYFGEIEEMPEKKGKELIISCVNLSALALYEPPMSDITVGDYQVLGIPMAFGGPYGGFVACRDEYKRQLPGRIVGRTIDAEGHEAYVLTLQAREQHIRREKATSNICSNQALTALCATVYVDLMGAEGLENISKICFNNAHKLAQGLVDKGYDVLSDEFFNEFVVNVKDSDKFLSKMKENKILAGIKLDGEKILVSSTEMNDEKEIKKYIELA